MLRACVFISCVVIIADCFNHKSGNCDGCRNEYTRIKRAKYYSSSPLRFYNRPPFSPSIRGPFSYTPPPGYTPNDVGPPTPSNLRPYKVSKRPANDGLGDEDLHNLFKYLSNKDLDKIVEFANEKERYSEKYRETSHKNNYEIFPDLGNNENLSFKDQIYESDRTLNSPNTRANDNRYYNSNNDNSNIKYSNNEFKGPIQNYQPYSQVPVDTHDFKNEEQFSFLDSYIQKEIEHTSPDKSNIFTDSTTMEEEHLPKPTNLRNDDHEISFTSDVVSVVRPETSYKLENFADLPLMGFENSKLHTVSSYNVPHYSVTSSDHRPINPSSSFSSFRSSPSLFSKPSSHNTFDVEPAPPASVAKEQSDAHLKAIKIWTHKSKGTAYTLHDDGTLTLEQPNRLKFNYN